MSQHRVRMPLRSRPSCGGEFPDYECDQEAVGLVWVIDRVEARCGGHWSSTGSVLFESYPYK